MAAALVRGIARHSVETIGNFWVDLVRVTYYLLLPLCLVFALFLVSQGMIQNFRPYSKAALVEAMKVTTPKVDADNKPILDASGQPVMQDQTVTEQSIVQGPMASQVRDSVMLGHWNGGGYAITRTRLTLSRIPTPLSNFLQMLSIFAIASGLTFTTSAGWLGINSMARTVWAGYAGNPVFVGRRASGLGIPRRQATRFTSSFGLAAVDGNMEGKEVRFGIFNSALFATVTTDASCGAVNSMHDSFTPLGGLVPLFNIQLGEIIFGGVGAGLYGMLVFVILAVFIAGLMVGRTPEYLGKKIEAYDVKMSMLALLVLAVDILAFAAWAIVRASGDWAAA